MRRSELVFYNEGELRICRYNILNNMAKVEVEQLASNEPEMAEMLAIRGDEHYAQELSKYLRFMYT